MKTVSQVTNLTAISARTLQYYDEIGLLKPSKLTHAGYRLYDDEALQKLQQILFFKELGFKLKEINEFFSQPDFDKIAAFKRQKELFLLKRNRTDRLIQLLSRLEKGEQCMSFKEFDLTDYINALEDFKKNSTDSIIKHWGSIENFDLFISKIKEDEAEVAKLAIQQFGSIEKYTEAMKYNLDHFSEIMEKQMTDDVKEIMAQSDDLYTKLTADLSIDPTSDSIQNIVRELDIFMHKHSTNELANHDCWKDTIAVYSSEFGIESTDRKYGTGSAAYIVKAFQCYSNHYQNNN